MWVIWSMSAFLLAAAQPPALIEDPGLVAVERARTGAPTAGEQAALVAAENLMGMCSWSGVSTPRWARVVESERVAGSLNVDAWVVAFWGVVVERGLDCKSELASVSPRLFIAANTTEVDVTLVIGESLELLSASTCPRAEWVAPVGVRPPFEITFDRVGWHLGPDPVPLLRSDVCDVLQALWMRGVHPVTPGQIFIRPRTVTCEVTAVLVEGELQRTYEEEVLWLVQVEGMITNAQYELYSTGEYSLLEDGSPLRGMSTSVP